MHLNRTLLGVLYSTCAGKCLTDRGSHAIAFRVDKPPNLGEVAVSLGHILDAGWLHQQRIVRCEHTLDSLIIVLHQRCLLPAAHERPHLLIRGYLGFLRRENEDVESYQHPNYTCKIFLCLLLWMMPIAYLEWKGICRMVFLPTAFFSCCVLCWEISSFAVPGTSLLAQLWSALKFFGLMLLHGLQQMTTHSPAKLVQLDTVALRSSVSACQGKCTVPKAWWWIKYWLFCIDRNHVLQG